MSGVTICVSRRRVGGRRRATATKNWEGEIPVEMFDRERARSCVGRYAVVSITYFGASGEEIEREWFHGVIVSAARTGITIALHGANEGVRRVIPPGLDLLREADPGTYSVGNTEELVTDPDFIVSLAVMPGTVN